MSDFEFKQETPKAEAAKLSAADLQEKSPQEKPEAPKYDKDELLAIFDDVIFTGEYTEQVTIKNKLKVTFRTRTADEISQISKALDIASYNLVQTMQDARWLMNLQYALVEYHGKSLGPMKVEERTTFIGKLPSFVVGSLIEALVKFDTKVAAACRELEGNF